MLACGIAEFDNGDVARMLGVDADDSDSFIRDWLDASEEIERSTEDA
jgi:hypothetical protein